MANDSNRPMRYAAFVIVVLVLGAVLLPAVDALGALGYFQQKTYLLVLQDNTELRNTGGYLACVGTVDVQNGLPENLKLVYTQGATDFNTSNVPILEINGPRSFTGFYNKTLVAFRDLNVQYDFATFAPLCITAYEELTGQHVDGVIAIDFTALQQLLKTTGPMTVGNDTITWRNVVDRVHYASAHSTQKPAKTDLTTFLTELATKLIATIETSDPITKLLMLNTLQTLSQQRHVLVYAPDAVTGRDGALQTTTGDYVSVVDSNYNGSKADLNVNRTLTYQTHLHDDGTQTSNLTISYQNNNWWNYNVFTTALVPQGARLLDARYTSQSTGPFVTHSANLTTLSSQVVVPPHTTANVTYAYTLPAMISSGGVFSHYTLYVQKQAGIDQYTLNTAVTLPQGAQLVRESNVGSETGVTGDVQAEVIYR